MKRIMKILRNKINCILAVLLLSCSVISCDSVLGYPDEDCSVEYRVRFSYDYNMKYANAFAREVKTVTLYIFDDKGKFIDQRTEAGEILKADDYSMKLDVEPGKYHLVAWAGLDDKSFAIPLLTPGKSDIDELTVKTNRIIKTRANEEEAYIVNSKLSSLWHGESLHILTRAAQQTVITIPLVKNTNTIRIILQQMQGTTVDVNKFDFSIYDDNGWMNYDNTLLKDNMLTYQPYYKTQGTTTRATKANSDETTSISVAIAEITVARLMADKNPRLRITNKDTGKTVLSIPLVDYLLLTEQESHNMGSQEYLDRQDEYSMTFFLDSNMNWLNTQIIINGWTIRLNDTDL